MDNLFIYIFIFFFGAIIGSFLNVVILRMNTGQSIVFDQSKCFSCAKKLKWYELFPIISFLALRGRCSDCKAKISWQYPLVEAVTGGLFLSVFLKFVDNGLPSMFYWMLVISCLIVIAVYDYRHQIIPDLFVWIFNGLAFIGLFHLAVFNWRGFFAGVILFSFFALLWFAGRGRWMGFGDAKLALGIGWILGMLNGAAAIMISFWAGAIIGILLLFLSRGKYNIKNGIAFGPFMIFGFFVTLFFGEFILGFILLN